jgi:GxxExxY protein
MGTLRRLRPVFETSRGSLEASQLNLITGDVIGAALRIHSALGPGLLESVYEVVLARDLARKGYLVERQKPISFEFEGMVFTEGFRADLLVEDAIVVEVKSVALLAPVHASQVLTYLRLLDYPVGLLINFGVARLREGIKRIANADFTSG